jgi:hypothetical protein
MIPPIFLKILNHFVTIIALIFAAAPTSVLCDWPPLHKAAYEGDVSTAKSLIASGALLNQKDFKYAPCFFSLQPAMLSSVTRVQ